MRRRTHTSENYFQEAVVKTLLELKNSDLERFRDLISFPIGEVSFLSAKLEWLGNEKSLRVFFDMTRSKEKLSCTWESLKNIFIGYTPIGEKVIWQSEINELLYLIDRFRDEGIIRRHKTPHRQLQKCFLNRYGEQLNSKSMASTLYKGVRRENQWEHLEKIIQAVLKANSNG